ncbi:MAG: hypothetical protein AAGA68_21925 [Pseudomonadota bacterium]
MRNSPTNTRARVCRYPQALLAALLALMTPTSAVAVQLEVSPSAPAIAHIAAAVLLYLHIGGGAVGLVLGVIAAVARKGGELHRAAGYTFVVSMAITYLIGAAVAPFLTEGQRPNLVAGVLALYLLASSLMTARRREFRASWTERVGLALALAITGMGLYFMFLGANSATGTVDGSPPQAFVLFVFVGVAAVYGEANAIIRKKLFPAARVSRHLWRVCVSFFIASGSFFLGQPQVFPEAFNDTLAPVALAFAPLLMMVAFLLRTRFSRLHKST